MTIENKTQEEPFLWIDLEINDWNTFSEVVHSWDIDFLQLDGGTFHSELKQMILPEIIIGNTHFNCHLDQKGTSPEDMWSFIILAEDSSMFKFNHVSTKSTSTMLIYSPGYEINAVTHEGFHIYGISIKQAHLHKITQSLGFDNIEDKLSKIDRVDLDSKQADTLRTQLKDILNDAASLENKAITAEGKDLLLNFVPMKFLKAIGSQLGCTPEKIIKEKNMAYMEVRAYMHTHLHESISVEELSNKFNISVRSLRNYFKEELNTSPKQYLTALRLTKIRGELQVLSMEKGLIEKTARKFGFNHMGQFSKAYKDFFGELPSETLRQI